MFLILFFFIVFGNIAFLCVESEIIVNDLPVIIKKSNDVVLFCILSIPTNVPSLMVEWSFFNGTWHILSTDEVNETVKNATLFIKKGSYNEAGKYICKFTQKSDMFNETSSYIEVHAQPFLKGLEVVDEEHIERKNFLRRSVDKDVGEDASISYDFYSYPEANVFMMKSNEIPVNYPFQSKESYYKSMLELELENFDTSQERITFTNKSFSVTDVQLDDAGLYAVVINNTYGMVKVYVIFRVRSYYEIAYPFLGIFIEAFLVGIVIMIGEMRRNDAEKRGDYTTYED